MLWAGFWEWAEDRHNPLLWEEMVSSNICTFALIGTYRVSNKFSAQHWRCHPGECEPKKRWYTGSAVSTLVSAIVSEIQRNPPGLLSALHQAECPWEDFFILIFSSRHWTLFIPCQSDKNVKVVQSQYKQPLNFLKCNIIYWEDISCW